MPKIEKNFVEFLAPKTIFLGHFMKNSHFRLSFVLKKISFFIGASKIFWVIAVKFGYTFLEYKSYYLFLLRIML